MEDYSSFQTALDYLNDKDLELEAQAAAVNIGRTLIYSYPSEVKAELEKIAKKTANESMARRAKEIIEKINSNRDYLMSWQISGPYVQDDKDFDGLFANRFAPEQVGYDELPWKRIASSEAQNRPTHTRKRSCQRKKSWGAGAPPKEVPMPPVSSCWKKETTT